MIFNIYVLRESDEQETFDGSSAVPAKVEEEAGDGEKVEAVAKGAGEEVKREVEGEGEKDKLKVRGSEVLKYVQLVAKTKRRRRRWRRRRSSPSEMTAEMRERQLLAWRWRRGVVKRAAKNGLGARILCRFTGKTFTSTRDYFESFLNTKVRVGAATAAPDKHAARNDDDDDDDDGKLVIDEGGSSGEVGAEEPKGSDEFAALVIN